MPPIFESGLDFVTCLLPIEDSGSETHCKTAEAGSQGP